MVDSTMESPGNRLAMLTIRCTRKPLKGLDDEVPPERTLPTNRLGDWYANFLFARRAGLIICVSERSLLPVFVEAETLLFHSPLSRGSPCQSCNVWWLHRMWWTTRHARWPRLESGRLRAAVSWAR